MSNYVGNNTENQTRKYDRLTLTLFTGSYYYIYFTNAKINTGKVSKGTKITQLMRQTQTINPAMSDSRVHTAQPLSPGASEAGAAHTKHQSTSALPQSYISGPQIPHFCFLKHRLPTLLHIL